MDPDRFILCVSIYLLVGLKDCILTFTQGTPGLQGNQGIKVQLGLWGAWWFFFGCPDNYFIIKRWCCENVKSESIVLWFVVSFTSGRTWPTRRARWQRSQGIKFTTVVFLMWSIWLRKMKHWLSSDVGTWTFLKKKIFVGPPGTTWEPRRTWGPRGSWEAWLSCKPPWTLN